MIVYVDLEHERLRKDPAHAESSLAECLKIKYRLEGISGQPCLIVRYDRLNPGLLHEHKIRAVLVGGNSTDWEHYSEADLAGLRAVFREAAWPTLGFCGGCQMLAQSYGAEISPLGPLPSGAPDPYTHLRLSPGMKQERGFMPLRVVQPHPLFESLAPLPVVYQSHYWEIKSPPHGFRTFAETDLTAVQMIAHERLPLYGTQFHPELYDAAHPDGRILLENFFRTSSETVS